MVELCYTYSIMKRAKDNFLRHKTWLLAIVLVTLVWQGMLALNRHNVHVADDNYFAQQVRLVAAYDREQATALGAPASDQDLHKECFRHTNVGSGPAGGGLELWCGVFVEKAITVNPDETYIFKLLQKLDATVRQEGFAVTTAPQVSLAADEVVYGARANDDTGISNAGCQVSVVYTPVSNTPQAVPSPNKVKYELSCAAGSSHVVPGFAYSHGRDLY